ncbi:hypothetical protein DFH07DRAFT_765297 [Mycena maculata]|uniref:Uncharacterized protein n=1 Tax=Mycena maculata TaxID=230809 RepID=A0AAD7KAU5_9AGAR|nr:hypothetical protein DFH07DRAFT_765297 [Mycena maculata]
MYHKEDATEFLSEDEEEVPDLVEVVSDDDVNATGEQRLVMYAHPHSSLPSRVLIATGAPPTVANFTAIPTTKWRIPTGKALSTTGQWGTLRTLVKFRLGSFDPADPCCH